jgi:hypothetical protein
MAAKALSPSMTRTMLLTARSLEVLHTATATPASSASSAAGEGDGRR